MTVFSRSHGGRTVHEGVGPAATDRLLAAGGPDLPAYVATGGYTGLTRSRALGREQLLEAVTESGLRGRGGAVFPVAAKWATALAEPGPRVVVANVAEDEPGSHKDRHLLHTRPHLVLEGLLVTAFALEAREAHLYVNEEATEALAMAHVALREAYQEGVCGDVDVTVTAAPAVYVAGEDSAAISFLQTGVARPQKKPPFPATSGLRGLPTVVSNAETLAHLALIARNGSDWFRAVGSESCPGTVLATVPDQCERPGIYEVATGTFLDELLQLAGGLLEGSCKGVQVGGPAAGFLAGADLHVRLEPEELTARGTALGCLALRVLPLGDCAVDAVAQVASFFAREQCGACPSCRMVTQFIDRATGMLAANLGVTAAQLDKAAELIGKVAGTTNCALPRFPLAPLVTARALFPDDFTRHLSGQDCDGKHRAAPLTITD